jgi:hypothetical protein
MRARTWIGVGLLLCGALACTPKPKLASLAVNGVFTVFYPDGWTASKGAYRNATELRRPGAGKPRARRAC